MGFSGLLLSLEFNNITVRIDRLIVIPQIVRLRKGSPAVEIEWTVGPIPIDDSLGKEVISRFESSLSSDKTISTDSNGRFVRK